MNESCYPLLRLLSSNSRTVLQDTRRCLLSREMQPLAGSVSSFPLLERGGRQWRAV